MPEQALSRVRPSVTGSIRSRRTGLPLRESLDSFRTNVVRICHDLRLPLTAILANAEFLTKPRLTETERGEFYYEIRSSIDLMSEMILSLLEGSTEIETVWPMERDVVQTVERAIHNGLPRKSFLLIGNKE
jgi:K+-sensing histidine kinase KdpD